MNIFLQQKKDPKNKVAEPPQEWLSEFEKMYGKIASCVRVDDLEEMEYCYLISTRPIDPRTSKKMYYKIYETVDEIIEKDTGLSIEQLQEKYSFKEYLEIYNKELHKHIISVDRDGFDRLKNLSN